MNGAAIASGAWHPGPDNPKREYRKNEFLHNPMIWGGIQWSGNGLPGECKAVQKNFPSRQKTPECVGRATLAPWPALPQKGVWAPTVREARANRIFLSCVMDLSEGSSKWTFHLRGIEIIKNEFAAKCGVAELHGHDFPQHFPSVRITGKGMTPAQAARRHFAAFVLPQGAGNAPAKKGFEPGNIMTPATLIQRFVAAFIDSVVIMFVQYALSLVIFLVLPEGERRACARRR